MAAEPIETDLLEGLPQRISDVVAPWAERSPDRVALVDADGAWTYAQLADAIAQTRVWLAGQGIRPGDRVMIVNENSRALLALMLAAAQLDAWIILVNARLSGQEIEDIHRHCDARQIFYLTSLSPLARKHAEAAGAAIDATPFLGRVGLGPLNLSEEPEPVAEESADQVAALVYTSGTSGTPKGVMLTHRNLLYMARISGILRAISPADRVYGLLPVSHIVGLSVVALGTLFHGATLYLSARFNPSEVLAVLQRERLTVMLGVPTMFALLAEYAQHKGLKRAENTLRVISTSGAPLDPATKAAAEELLGLPLHQGYGITECAPTISQARIGQPADDRSAGRLLPGLQVRLIGAGGEAAAPGETGELWVRGPNVMKGYYRSPEETVKVIDAQGWFNTRDLARLEGDRLFIVGRTKELIIRFGFNVSPSDVEAVLNAHPAVTLSAVVGRKVGEDEEIVAFVQPVPGSSVTAADLARHAAANLAPYKHPSEIILLPSLPTSSTGKILKSKLLVPAAGAQAS